VVIAAEGYPEAAVTGDVIDGLDDAADVDGASVFHAGTGVDADGRVVTTAGRVLSVVGTGRDLAAARATAYEAVGRIRLRGAHYRTDVAASALLPGAVSAPVG
jgi:phosphoribosylamine---glycine ligase